MSSTRLYDWDSLGLSEALSDSEKERIKGLRKVLDSDVRPAVNDWWERAVLPAGVIERLGSLRLLDPPAGSAGPIRPTFTGFRNFELARADASIATVYNAHAGLFRTAVKLGVHPDKFPSIDDGLRDFSQTGAFALTEPDHGSDIARGMETIAQRTSEGWVITGRKRWIGGALTATTLAVFARESGGTTASWGFSCRPALPEFP
jgi:glutaryl-CoA dehydrogenase